MSNQIEVKEYKSAGEFQADARRMAERGYIVVSQSERTVRRGCLPILLTGGLALIRKPKPVQVVTYRRE